jgi:hypothetical protein
MSGAQFEHFILSQENTQEAQVTAEFMRRHNVDGATFCRFSADDLER